MEDLEGQAGAGLYDSVLNVQTDDMTQIKSAVTQVWLSLFTKRAVISRRQIGFRGTPLMAVLAQEQIESAYSFVIHTKDPFNNSGEGIYAELAVGLGETLASANQPGLPYKFKTDGKGEID